ncbi:MAG: DUF3352 domain-containing protein [Mediterranea massiliensis]|nr:DUF3352 domain-containing protein [Mediterranea massiliensis]
MKTHIHIRIIAIVIAILLVCMGLALYSFWQLNAKEQKGEFDLYTLVPQNTFLVVETARMPELLDEINSLDCSRNGHFLNFSELFNSLKVYLNSMLDEVPHGLSHEMNRMLLSFHEPNTSFDQVLYWGLGDEDNELVEEFINQYYVTDDWWKEFEYRGEEGRIYPIDNQHFLVVWMNEDFLVASFQKRLVEQVIDAWKDNASLAKTESFKKIHAKKTTLPMATAYVDMQKIEMGSGDDLIPLGVNFGEWAEFDLAFDGSSIFCSGITQAVDSTYAFVSTLLEQPVLQTFPGNRLPLTTFFFDTWALTRGMTTFVLASQGVKTMGDVDSKWSDFLNNCAQGEVLKTLFHVQDSSQQKSCGVLSVLLADEQYAKRALNRMWKPCSTNYVASELVYELPSGLLMSYLVGGIENDQPIYAMFYQGYLLLAAEVFSLQQYVKALNGGNVLEKLPAYGQRIAGLATEYNFLLMVDMEKILSNREAYVRLLPNYFFRQAEFFKHFILAIQFTCSEGVVYPNLVLQYKY